MEYRNVGSVITKIAKVVCFRFGLKSVKLNVHKTWENSDQWLIMTRRSKKMTRKTDLEVKQSSSQAAIGGE